MQRLPAAADPAAVRVADELLGRAAAERQAAYARDARDDVALQVPPGEIAPGPDQDLVRQHAPHLALQPADEVRASRDQPRFAQHAHQLRFLQRIESEGVIRETGERRFNLCWPERALWFHFLYGSRHF